MDYCPPELRGENVIRTFRMHWFVIISRVATGLSLMIVGILIGILIPMLVLEARSYPWINIILLTTSLLVLYGWGVLSYGLFLYFLTLAILTDEALVDVDQRSLFDRKISTLNLIQIQDVTVRQTGLIPTFLNFGDVVVQTAGELPEFTFDNVPNPQKLSQEILDAHNIALQKKKTI